MNKEGNRKSKLKRRTQQKRDKYMLKIPRGMTTGEWRNHWNIPDWTLPATYPINLSNDQLRWEFLRRDGDYRTAWLQEIEDRYDNVSVEEWPDKIYCEDSIGYQFGLNGLFINPRINASILPKDSIFDRTNQGTIFFDTPPETSANLSTTKQKLLHDAALAERVRDLLYDGKHIVAVFDLTRFMEPQLERLTSMLKAYRKNNNNHTKDKRKEHTSTRRGRRTTSRILERDTLRKHIQHYLRALDARAERVKTVVIGMEIFGVKKSAEVAGSEAILYAQQVLRWL